LKAPISDAGKLEVNEKGTPQGGVISPILANIALNGMEEKVRKEAKAVIIRYADDFLVLHHQLETIELSRNIIEKHLEIMGLELHPTKTKVKNMRR